MQIEYTRNTILDPPVGLVGIRTYNGFWYDENIRSLKIAIREGQPQEAAFRVLEAVRTSTTCAYDVTKVLLLCACSEVGAANPSLVVMIDNLIGRDVSSHDYLLLVMAAELLAISHKSRQFALLKKDFKTADFQQRCENEVDSLKASLVYIETYLDDGDFHQASEEAYKVSLLTVIIDKALWVKLTHMFGNPSRTKRLQHVSAGFWLPVLSKAERCESQKVCNVVYRLYNMSCSRSSATKISLRKHNDVMVVWLQALWCLCNMKQVEDTWYEDGNLNVLSDVAIMSDTERDTFLSQHLTRRIK